MLLLDKDLLRTADLGQVSQEACVAPISVNGDKNQVEFFQTLRNVEPRDEAILLNKRSTSILSLMPIFIIKYLKKSKIY